MNRWFVVEDINNQHMKRCSASLVWQVISYPTALEDSQILLQKMPTAAEGVLTWMAGGLLSRTPLGFRSLS